MIRVDVLESMREKLASTAPAGAPPELKGVFKKKLVEGLGEVPGRAIGAGVAGLGALIGAKFLMPKPTIAQEMFGRGGAVPRALAYGAMAAGLGGGAALAVKGVGAVHDNMTKERDLKKAIELNPSLKEHSPKDLRDAFNTLRNFSPDISKDPLTAGAFLRRSMLFKDEGIQPTDIKTLTDIRKSLSEARKSEGASDAFLNALTMRTGDVANLTRVE